MYQIRLSATFAPPSLKAFLLEFPALCCAVLHPLRFRWLFALLPREPDVSNLTLGSGSLRQERSRALTEPTPVGKSLAVP